MTVRQFLISIFLLVSTNTAISQQIGDEGFEPPVLNPAYEVGKGPHILVDQAHNNFHTVDGRYKPFAQLLRRDGYNVSGLNQPLSALSLQDVDVLVIANPLHNRNVRDWSLPTPSAFTEYEILSLLAWVESGGSLFLIADHMPFPGAVRDLAKAFGIEFSNGFATPGHRTAGMPDRFAFDTGLKENVVTLGRDSSETVTQVTTFTGSAFKTPQHAKSILVFGNESMSREPQQAWQFNAQTTKISIEGWSQLAIMEAGRGRIAISGEAAMFSAQLAGPKKVPMGMNSPDARQNPQLLLNLMHWLSRLPGTKHHAEPAVSLDAESRQ